MQSEKKPNIDGLAIHLRGSTENQSNKFQFVSSSQKINKKESLILSEEHLREFICIKSADLLTIPLVLTSALDDGVIKIFIALDEYPVVQLANKCAVVLAMREYQDDKLSSSTYPVLENDIEKLQLLQPGIVTLIQPSSFKSSFPKLANPLQLQCQFALYSGNNVELSKPVTINNETSMKLYVPAYGHVMFNSYIQNSQLYVEISQEDKINSPRRNEVLNIPNIQISISSLDAILIDRKNVDELDALLSISLSSLRLIHTPMDYPTFQMSIGGLQIDNPTQEDVQFHFPVILLPMREVSQRYHNPTRDVPFPDLESGSDAPFFMLSFDLNRYNINGLQIMSLDHVRIQVQPFEMFLEDIFIYKLSKVIKSFIPGYVGQSEEDNQVFLDSIKSILYPLRICDVEVFQISILLSIHASVKVFLAADHIPLNLGKFQCTSTQTIKDELVRVILYHYAKEVLVRVGWILGSLEIIGNPTGLIHSVGRGLSDFVYLPYQGLTRGPTAFVSGISHGFSSFLKHLSTGTLTSITNVSSSISRNMDRLSLDETHFRLQEERRTQIPSKTTVTGKILYLNVLKLD